MGFGTSWMSSWKIMKAVGKNRWVSSPSFINQWSNGNQGTSTNDFHPETCWRPDAAHRWPTWWSWPAKIPTRSARLQGFPSFASQDLSESGTMHSLGARSPGPCTQCSIEVKKLSAQNRRKNIWPSLFEVLKKRAAWSFPKRPRPSRNTHIQRIATNQRCNCHEPLRSGRPVPLQPRLVDKVPPVVEAALSRTCITVPSLCITLHHWSVMHAANISCI